MWSTIKVRRSLVNRYLHSEAITRDAVQPLRNALEALQAIPTFAGASRVDLDEQRTIDLDLGYEINELVKDIFFLEHSEDEFLQYLGQLHEGFEDQVEQGVEALANLRLKAFLTDRDGTVNNYCGRYASSVQSVYNAVFLTRFATSAVDGSVILTSAPLANVGLVDISVSPANVFTFAGSKGREYFNTHGERRVFPIEADKQSKLDMLNQRLSDLVNQRDYEKFSLIGSGLQFKFGQTTIARQDITRSVSAEASESFLTTIKTMVTDIDPTGAYFRIEDTGLDVEVILTVESDQSGAAKDFDKGDGIRFLNEDIGLGMADGSCLICGDTNSDVPMVTASMEIAKETHAVFVTRNEDLKAKVKTVCPRALCVDEPDMLVTILNALSERR
jgi:hypothetical protein